MLAVLVEAETGKCRCCYLCAVCSDEISIRGVQNSSERGNSALGEMFRRSRNLIGATILQCRLSLPLKGSKVSLHEPSMQPSFNAGMPCVYSNRSQCSYTRLCCRQGQSRRKHCTAATGLSKWPPFFLFMIFSFSILRYTSVKLFNATQKSIRILNEYLLSFPNP